MSNNTILATAPLATTGFHIKATGTTLGNSLIWDNGTNVGIGNTNTSYTLDVSGTLRNTTSAYFATASGSVGIGTTTTTGVLTFPLNTTNSQISTGSLELQSYAVNNSWIGDNLYFDGSFFKARNNGYIQQIYFNANGSMGFATNSTIYTAGQGVSVAAKMTILTSGNVGIGTSSPQANLQVTSSAFPVLKVADGVGGGALALGDSAITSNYVGVWRGAANSISGGGFLNIQGNGIAFMSSDSVFGSGSERMRITSAGNVGIGTSSPNVSGQGTDQRVLTIQGVGGVWGGVEVSVTGNTSAGALNGFYGFTNASLSAGYKLVSYIGSWLDGGGVTSGADMRFHTQPNGGALAERMRITSGGNVLVGKTTNSGRLAGPTVEAQGTFYSGGSQGGYFWEDRSTSANWYGWYATSNVIYLYNGSANAAQIIPSTGVYTALSDKNKKKDFEVSTIGLNAVLGLKPTLYRMKTDDESASKELGFIAQEVKEYIPQAYVESGEGKDIFIGLNYNAIVAALVKAVQEQNQTIQNLQEQINILAK